MAEVAISVRHLAELYHLGRSKPSPDEASQEALEACLDALESQHLSDLPRNPRAGERGEDLHECDWRTPENQCPNCAFPIEEESREERAGKPKEEGCGGDEDGDESEDGQDEEEE
jgi:hypothetical protein